jgi:hypothetical protein
MHFQPINWELAVQRDIVDHRAPVQRSGRGGPEHVFVLQIVAVIQFLAAPVQVA